MCNYDIIDVCGKVCEQPLEEKREREREVTTTTSYSNLRWLF